jgi:hypothetical protein
MKKVLLLTLLICIFVSCNTQLKKSDEYWDSQTMFIVKSIRKGRGMEKFVIYTVEVVDANGISHSSGNASTNLEFEFSDTINKYKVGQAVHFTKY